MKIERIAETALTPADDAAIAELLLRAFGPAFGGKSYHHQRHHLRVVARDPVIVGHFAITLRTVRLGAAVFEVAGLAEVATDPALRGKGIATLLLAESIAAARDLRLPFVLLFGVAKLYAAAGFRSVPNMITFTEIGDSVTRGVRIADDEALMVLPIRDRAWDDTAPLDLLGHLF